jgi:hypothetical protein
MNRISRPLVKSTLVGNFSCQVYFRRHFTYTKVDSFSHRLTRCIQSMPIFSPWNQPVASHTTGRFPQCSCRNTPPFRLIGTASPSLANGSSEENRELWNGEGLFQHASGSSESITGFSMNQLLNFPITQCPHANLSARSTPAFTTSTTRRPISVVEIVACDLPARSAVRAPCESTVETALSTLAASASS